ncbi:hypothetical protein [Streptomyces sp. NPDC058268]|uniref:hypothetical protein n=1 Tax=Streptomyces sp. NPDC058268 TaxID=3346413 RepID=UPI0036E98F42
METHKVGFDPMDVPRDRFQVAGDAWQRIRAGEADPKSYGLPLPDGPLVGEWFVVGSVRLDLAALNKVETLLWDVWGVGASSDREMTDTIRKLYDRAAEMTVGEASYSATRQLFTENYGLRTPRTVTFLAPFNGPSEVALRDWPCRALSFLVSNRRRTGSLTWAFAGQADGPRMSMRSVTEPHSYEGRRGESAAPRCPARGIRLHVPLSGGLLRMPDPAR